MGNQYKFLGRKPEINMPLGRQKTHSKLGNNIKTYLKEIGYQVNGKGEVRPRTGHEGPEEEFRYSSTLSARR
jgi:hypothetical protein